MNDRRILTDRSSDASDQLDRIPLRQGGTPVFAGQVYDGGKMPSAVPAWFLVHPVDFSGDEAEGSPYGVTADEDRSIPVIVLNKVPAVGDILIAELIGSKWVAQLGSSSIKCHWLCGPIIAIDPPRDPSWFGARATLAVADDGSIASVTLLYAGNGGYDLAHPRAIISGGGGSGATAEATVGEVVGLSETDGGGGYDPDNPPAVTIAAPGTVGGETATATATVNPDGTISVTLTDGGALYPIANPTVTIDPPSDGPNARQATAIATARPGFVTSLKLLTKGSGYTDNTPPDYLDFTVSCPAWSKSLRLDPGLPADSPAFAPSNPPDGPPVYCSYSATTTIESMPGGCGTLQNVTMCVIVTNTVRSGWCLMVDFKLGPDFDQEFDCPDTEIGPIFGLPCLMISDAYSEAFPQPHGPYDAIGIACESRPFAITRDVTVTPTFGGIFGGDKGWMMLGGGHCPDGVTFTFSLSEPPPS